MVVLWASDFVKNARRLFAAGFRGFWNQWDNKVPQFSSTRPSQNACAEATQLGLQDVRRMDSACKRGVEKRIT